MRSLVILCVLIFAQSLQAQMSDTAIAPPKSDWVEAQRAAYVAKALLPNCHCEVDTLMTINTSCDTLIFSNGAKFIRFFNCDSLWSEFVLPNGKRSVVFSYESLLYGYDYRLGYQVAREFKNAVLFRYGCPANGPCDHMLIDKVTGRLLLGFGELIYKGVDPDSRYVASFNWNRDSIKILNVESLKTASIRVVPERFIGDIPEYSFHDPVYDRRRNLLTLKYDLDGNLMTLPIALNKLKWYRVRSTNQ